MLKVSLIDRVAWFSRLEQDKNSLAANMKAFPSLHLFVTTPVDIKLRLLFNILRIPLSIP